MNTAVISLLLKPKKGPTLPSNYRPISQLTELKKVTPDIIHPDQTGFIKGKEESCNTHWLVDLIHYSSLQQEDMPL